MLDATVSGTVNGDVLDYTLATTAGQFSNVGDYGITVTLGANSNYSITPTDGMLSIGQKAATVTANNKTKTYGDANPVLDATVSGTVNGDVLDYTLATTAGQFSNVGDYGITVTLGVNNNYSITPSDGTLSIGQKAATVTANNKTKTYGDANPVLDATVSGTVNGDVLDYTLATTAGQFSNVGDYGITVTLGVNSNYSVTPTDGTLSIGQKAATVTANNKAKTYGDANPVLDATVSGTVNGDVLDYTLATTAGQFSNVGDYGITVTLGVNNNYSVTPTDGTLSIGQKAATVTANNKAKTYGDANPVLDATVSGTVNGDVLDYTLATTAGQFSNVGDYGITVTLGVNNNYSITPTDGTLSISKANATVVVSGYSGTYDSQWHGATGSASGIAGEALMGLDLGATFINAPGGTASWTFTDVTGNYNDASGTAAIVINKASAQVIVSGYSGTYDALSHGATGLVVGVAGDPLAVGSSLDLGPSFTNAPGGTANWTFNGGTNYLDQSGSVAISIGRRAITVTADNKSKIYGSADPVLTYQVSSGSLAATDAFFGSLARASGENVGSYAINRGSLNLGSVSGNYELSFVGATLQILHATLSGDATTQDALNMAKQGKLNITISNLSGFANGENAGVFLAGSSFWITVAGQKYAFVPSTVTKLSNSSIAISTH